MKDFEILVAELFQSEITRLSDIKDIMEIRGATDSEVECVNDKIAFLKFCLDRETEH